VIFGVGAGWNRQEMQNHGTDPKTRMRLLTGRVQAMIEIWTKPSTTANSLTSTRCRPG
jgi:alkanesulfonate monooxygenase SsuD/methylene tetrahydromethanopterin reductase-like flavin-dependent oxidoreductase (luciferase family)